jgi:two-component system, OmpR family, sensor kinase
VRDAAGSTRRAASASWLAGRTLRTRLIAGLLALFTLASIGVALATPASLQPYLLDRLDQQLTAAGTAFNANNPPGGQGGPGGPGGSGGSGGSDRGQVTQASAPRMSHQSPGTLGVCIYSGKVTTAAEVTDYAGRTSSPRLSKADIAELRSLRPGTLTSVDLAGVGSYRVLASQQGNVLDVAGLPLASVQATIRHLQLIEIIVFGAALLVIGMAGTGWIRLTLRPLTRMTATAAEVTELPLASGAVELPHRVADADPRTEVGQLGAAFNRMLGHVESALARRHASEDRLRGFAADASHELRTPLAAIRGYAELARRYPGALPEEVAHALSRVQSESARMSALVEDLLLLARLDAGRPLERGAVNLTRLAIDATSDARVAGVAGRDHRWQLELPDGPVLVTGDAGRLHQVLANLLSNARTHTPAGTTVTVALRRTRDRPGVTAGAQRAELSVTDDGPGIPAELQSGLFERFVRGDTSRSRAAGSTGLGLAIVDAVIAAHGGTVAVTSQPGRTSFVIILPVLPDPGTPDS